MDLALDEHGLRHADVRIDDAGVRGFHERFDPWRGQVWLEVAGPGWRVPVDGAYGALRRELRARYRDRPFTSDWALGGWFPGLVLGRAPAPWFLVALLAVLAVVAVTGAVLGPVAGLAAGVVWAWPLGRLRPAVVVSGTGLRLGPPWAPRVPWHHVRGLRAVQAHGVVSLRALTSHGVERARLPAALWPACRARLRRLGGLVVEDTPADLDERYDGWRAWALGLPWGTLAGVLVAGAFTADPFAVWTWGGLAAAGLGCAGAAVEARASGWRTGGVVWLTVGYGVLLFALLLLAAR